MRFLPLIIVFGFLVGCGTNISRQSTEFGATQDRGPLDWPDVAASTPIERNGANDVALLVAIEDYTFLPDVPGAVRNAEDWRGFLQQNLGVQTVYTLYNQQASREEILRFAAKAAGEVGRGGRIWFVFVGHGAPSAGGEGILVGMDAQQTVDSLNARGAAQADVLASLRAQGAADVVMVVDACFSGRDAGGELLARGSQPVVPVGQLSVPTGVTIFSAAQANEFAGALPDTDRPAFSYLLLGAMRGWADDGDRVLRASEALAWTRSQLGHVTGRTQTPELHGNSGLVLTRNVIESDPGIADLMRGVSSQSNASSSGERFDTGKGVSFIPPRGWTLFSSVPADFYEESLTRVAEFHDSQNNSTLTVSQMRHGQDAFVANVKILRESFEAAGGQLVQQQAVEIDGRSGLFQRWRMPEEGKPPHAALAFYIKHGGHMWLMISTAPIDREDWILEVNQAVWNSIDFY